MRWRWTGLSVLAVGLTVTASCSGAKSGMAPTTSPTLSAEPLTALVKVSPDQGLAGSTFTFSVAIRGQGTLSEEGVQFGDGGSAGANAGLISCGETRRVDRTSTYTHVYPQPGAYTFSDHVQAIGSPPACVHEQVIATLRLIVAAPLSSTALNGAFLSPSQNIACYIDTTETNSVRCATFSPPRLVTMSADGSFQTCSGSTCNLGNPAMETPALPYGSATGSGPFQCLSSQAGMTCTVAGHKGFTISRAGVLPVVG